ncbi:MAG TPA: amino acid adenylation domain-containing protein [Acidimicrobiales bacterium]|nr:amino acid adenylation domain-containing protein [Acidimicrobiales bacterium]
MSYLLSHLLTEASLRNPAGVAVVDGARSLTYEGLEKRANQVANLLEELGVGPGDRVALYLDKSLDSVVGIYGILRAGAAYVPLDPDAPVHRLAFIVQNCGVAVVLTGAEKRERWPDLCAAAPTIRHLVVLNAKATEVSDGDDTIVRAGLSELDSQATSAAASGAISLDLAYILYTSGSTGDPKGVMLTHDNALAFVTWAAREFSVSTDDRLSSHAPLHFDLSVFDLFAASLAGAAVVLVPRTASIFPTKLASFIAQAEISVWYSVPSILSMLALRGGLKPGDLPVLRTVLFAGEVFPTKYLRKLMQSLPGVRFANLYGPTETNVCTWYDVPPLADEAVEAIPIGKPIDDVEVFVVGDDGRPVERGGTGELLVRGRTVMRGYWGDRERSAKGLVPDPLGRETGDLVYRTGDLVQQRDDGNYRYLGRRDSQIKSRGYRIELGDIEAALYAHPAVEECAVIAVPDELVSNRLRAYVVRRGDASEAELARFCAERLPGYMVPETFSFREALTKTSTGKIDRRSLAAEANDQVTAPPDSA